MILQLSLLLAAAPCSTSKVGPPLKPAAVSTAASQPGDIVGCLAFYIPSRNSFVYERFIKIADKESLSEDGQPEIWGFRTMNLEPPDAAGLTHPVNVLESSFIADGTMRTVGPRVTRCPYAIDTGLRPIDQR